MSKATDSADVDPSVTTEEPSVDTEPSVEPQGTARAISVKDTSHTDPLYGTDRTTARAIMDEARDHDSTVIRKPEVARFGNLLEISLRGTVAVSYNDVLRAINTDVYVVQNFLSHSSGSVTITLKTP
ncbi:hypothetical protein EXE44_05160 [Halorubrum sp. SS7]|uniref:hypothetical protein n=1 Tax=unclassified Halorubrum TaxID=2642239 RepID=UPI0010F78107|nr:MULTISPECIES: hypothetical protein [unclassified Halorubrum]TKX52750.1 hypothetical protein EXE42_15515 [Halorubrum sp. SP3]TKX58937.1 hypothetical protein EXE44_05160 [Halorubrum sp. SS7]